MIKGVKWEIQICGHRKSMSRDNQPGFMKYYKGQGRRTYLIRRAETRTIAELQQDKGSVKTAAKLKVEIHLYKTSEDLIVELESDYRMAQNHQNRIEEEEKKKRMNKWRQEVQEIPGAAKWVKSKSETPAKFVSGAETRGEVIELIHKMWEKEWDRTEEQIAECRRNAEMEIVEPLRRYVEGKEAPEWEEHEYREGMLKAHKRARGVAGADGFHMGKKSRHCQLE